MKAIVKKEAKAGLWLEEVPKPTIQDHEVLIKVKKASICGTDIHIYEWDEWAQKNMSPPVTIGHEFMGEIAEVGKKVTDLKVGDRVSAEGHVTCGCCHNCLNGKRHLCPKTIGIGIQRDGGFAEFVAVPGENIFSLPDSISDDLGAILDPFGNAVHTALSFDLAAKDVLITGAGPIGIMACTVAKKAGAHQIVVTDINPYRLDLAKKMGATCCVQANQVSLNDIAKSLNISEGFEVGLEMSGNAKAFNEMLEVMQPGGKIAMLGILPPNTIIDWDLVIFKMLEIKGIYGREIFNTWFQMVGLIESGLDLESIITHRFPKEDFETAFSLLREGNCGKVILDWNPGSGKNLS